jgi:predicted dehydrogenase
MDLIKIALIGCGNWGPNLLRNFNQQKNCEVRCIVDSSTERRTSLKKQFPNLTLLDDYEKCVDSIDINAVVIATPAKTHYSIAKKFLESGKHVFVEKPLTTSIFEALELSNIAASKKLVLMVGHTFLYNAALHFLKARMYSDLGIPYYLYSQRLNLGKIREDVNVWWNLAPHDISILLFLMNGEMPKTISMHGSCFLMPSNEDVIFAVLKWKNNFTAFLHLSWLDPGKTRKITLVGSKKMIVYDDVDLDNKIAIYDKGIDFAEISNQNTNFSVSYRSGDICLPKINMKEPLEEETKHFIECILHKKQPLTGPEHATDVVTILEAGQHSLLNNCEVEVEAYKQSQIYSNR